MSRELATLWAKLAHTVPWVEAAWAAATMDDQDLPTMAAECLAHTLERTTTLLQLMLFWDWG